MNNFINTKFASYVPQETTNQAFVKINSIDTGSFKLERDARLSACIGSRKTFKNCPYDFFMADSKRLQKVWTFSYKNAQRSSLVFVLYKKNFFGTDEEIGEIEIKLNALTCNRITNHVFVLRSPDKNAIPAKVSLSIHISENGSKPFQAPEGDKIRSDFEIFHKETYSTASN